MKKILACFFALFVINNVYSLGIGEADNRSLEALLNTDSVKAVEGLSEGYKLFIDVILEMQIANDKNFDMEYIINTYVSKSEFDNKTNYDWIKYLTGDIAAVKMKMTVFMNLLEIYVEKQKEIVFFNKNFYNGIILSLDEYKNKGYKIQEEKGIENLNIQGYKFPFWGDEYKVTAENYTIYFYYDRVHSKHDSTPLKKIIIDKKSGTTYFDKYIGSTRKMILSLRPGERYPDDEDILKFYNDNNYVLFYLENDVVKKIEYGDNLR